MSTNKAILKEVPNTNRDVNAEISDLKEAFHTIREELDLNIHDRLEKIEDKLDKLLTAAGPCKVGRAMMVSGRELGVRGAKQTDVMVSGYPLEELDDDEIEAAIEGGRRQYRRFYMRSRAVSKFDTK